MKTQNALRERFKEGVQMLGIEPADRLLDGGLHLMDMLRRWSHSHPLVAPAAKEQWLTHHLLDSLALLPQLKALRQGAGGLLDVGSGAGFPGLMLALAQPSLSVTLLDSRRRPCVFMRQAALDLELANVRVEQGRVESADWRGEELWPLITARAVAPPTELLPLIKGALAPEGVVLLPLGRERRQHPPEGWQYLLEKPLQVPFVEARRHLLVAGMKPQG